MPKKDNKQRRPRRTFTDEFKAGAARLVLEEGRSVTEVARDLDLTRSALRNWVEQAKADAGRVHPAPLRARSETSFAASVERTESLGWSETF